MGFLAELEQRIEGTIQRFFPKRQPGGVQPLEVARLLVRAAEDQRRVSVDVVYVPNRFEVLVSPADLSELEPMMRTVKQDVLRHIERVAGNRGWSFAGPVELRFAVQPALPPGEVRVEASFHEAAENRGGAPVEPEFVLGRVSRALVAGDEATRRFPAASPAGASGARLQVLSGPLVGALFLLSRNRPFLIGRHSEADLRLDDPQVSRRHAVLLWDAGAWRVVDQESTNGTLHNGVRVSEAVLSEGDAIVVGRTALQFRVD